ncbi:MAG: hypothetical protein PGN13_11420 [Patulibacter minatonensis]
MSTVAGLPAATTPEGLFAALLESSGGQVDGAAPGSAAEAPSVAGLTPERAVALRAAWTGARLHAGEVGLLAAADPDVALLVGDWCFAHALRAVAGSGDLQAIALLSDAIALGSTGPSGAPAPAPELAEIWGDAGRRMSC